MVRSLRKGIGDLFFAEIHHSLGRGCERIGVRIILMDEVEHLFLDIPLEVHQGEGAVLGVFLRNIFRLD